MTLFTITNKKLGRYLGQNGPTENPLSPGCLFLEEEEAVFTLKSTALAEAGWTVCKLVEFPTETNKNSPFPQTKPELSTKDILRNKKSICHDIPFQSGGHVLVSGEVQVGKLFAKQEIALVTLNQLKKATFILFRSNNADFRQFQNRLIGFNAYQREVGKPTLPVAVNVLTQKDPNLFADLVKSPNLIIGLANYETLLMIKTFTKEMNLKDKIVLILDEADLVSFELTFSEDDRENRTKTEIQMKEFFPDLFMMFSVTGTPGSILFCDKMRSISPIERPEDYFGFDRLNFKPLDAIKPHGKSKTGKSSQYDPELDSENLKIVMADILKNEYSTLLLSVSKLRNDHRVTIEFLSQHYSYLGDDIVYFEFNEKTIKIYDAFGNEKEPITEKTQKGKVCAIDKAIQQYIKTKYIVIVAGVQAARGTSVVSYDYTRHLTHQYIADSASTHLECGMQSVRLLGRYKDNPTLTLYCSQILYDDLLNQCMDMREFTKIAVKAKNNAENLPDVIDYMRKYSRNLFASRKLKGIQYLQQKLKWHYYLDTPNDEDVIINTIGGNIEENWADDLFYSKWPKGAAHIQNLDYKNDKHCREKERVILCNDRNDLPENYKYRTWLDKLYAIFPSFEGKWLRRKKIEVGENDIYIRKTPVNINDISDIELCFYLKINRPKRKKGNDQKQ